MSRRARMLGYGYGYGSGGGLVVLGAGCAVLVPGLVGQLLGGPRGGRADDLLQVGLSEDH